MRIVFIAGVLFISKSVSFEHSTSGNDTRKNFGSDLGLLVGEVPVANTSLSKKEAKVKKDNSPELSTYDMVVQCKIQANSFPCTKIEHSRYGYDIKMKSCIPITVGDCKYADINAFTTKKECLDTCRNEGEHPITQNLPPKAMCRLQPDFGNCDEYHPMFYYSVAHKECRGFSYSGCGGNMNKFETVQICSTTCATSYIE